MAPTNPPPRKKRPVRFYFGVLIFSGLALGLAGFVGVDALRSQWAVGTTPQFASCLPWSWYIDSQQSPTTAPTIGSMVIARTPKAFHGARLGKLVIGVPGDHILENKVGLWVNGHYWGRLWLRGWLHTAKHRPIYHLPYRFTVPPHHYLLLGTSPLSLDGRYWGMVTSKQIYGKIVAPL